MESRLQRTRSSSIASDLNHQPSAATMLARPKPQNFHVFIRSNDTNQISIRIPNKFTREYRKNILLNNVLIIVSDDKVWSLGWTISGDGRLCLQQGWPEFAEHYCLKTGHMLFFSHHGKSVFHVRIFDQSSCEINYASPTVSPKSEKKNDQPVTKDDPSMVMAETEALHAPSIFQEVKEKQIEALTEEDDQFTAMAETEVFHAPSIFKEIKEKQIEALTGEDDQFTAMAETEVFHAQSIFKEIKASEKEKKQRSRNRALESATSFKSDNPFFSVRLSVSYLRTGALHVPYAFLRRYMMRYSRRKCVKCVLEVSGGEDWGPVKCKSYNGYGRLQVRNWEKFRDENHLGVGDVCVLELIDERKRVLKVTIFRAC